MKLVCLLDVLCLLGSVVVVSKHSGDIGALNSHLDPTIHCRRHWECCERWAAAGALSRVQALGQCRRGAAGKNWRRAVALGCLCFGIIW